MSELIEHVATRLNRGAAEREARRLNQATASGSGVRYDTDPSTLFDRSRQKNVSCWRVIRITESCDFETTDGNQDDPSYAYCGRPLGHAGGHGDWRC